MDRLLRVHEDVMMTVQCRQHFGHGPVYNRFDDVQEGDGLPKNISENM